MMKFCVKCGSKFAAMGREVICPSCKEQAAEDARHAAVLRAKKASWNGEAVPVRISGRASTVIRRYSAANGLSFVQALDALLQSTPSFEKLGVEWSTIVPYKSRRKSDGEQASKPAKPVKQAARATSKAAKVASKATSRGGKA